MATTRTDERTNPVSTEHPLPDHDRPDLRARVRQELLYPTRSTPMVAGTTMTFAEFRAAIDLARAIQRAAQGTPAEPTAAELWESGQSLGEIAERLGMTIGEVAAAIREAE